jgi:hypothetical protein
VDHRVERLNTPEECEQFAINVQKRLPDLALAAKRKAVELRAAEHKAQTTVERQALNALYAYERVMSEQRGRKYYAARTWQMIDRRGIIPAIESLVNRPTAAIGYTALAEMGMPDLTFEAVVVNNRDCFTAEAFTKSTERLREWTSEGSPAELDHF